MTFIFQSLNYTHLSYIDFKAAKVFFFSNICKSISEHHWQCDHFAKHLRGHLSRFPRTPIGLQHTIRPGLRADRTCNKKNASFCIRNVPFFFANFSDSELWDWEQILFWQWRVLGSSCNCKSSITYICQSPTKRWAIALAQSEGTKPKVDYKMGPVIGPHDIYSHPARFAIGTLP